MTFVYDMMFAVMILVALLGNCATMCIIISKFVIFKESHMRLKICFLEDPRMRNVTNFFVFSLSFSDFLNTFFNTSFNFIYMTQK